MIVQSEDFVLVPLLLTAHIAFPSAIPGEASVICRMRTGEATF